MSKDINPLSEPEPIDQVDCVGHPIVLTWWRIASHNEPDIWEVARHLGSCGEEQLIPLPRIQSPDEEDEPLWRAAVGWLILDAVVQDAERRHVAGERASHVLRDRVRYRYDLI